MARPAVAGARSIQPRAGCGLARLNHRAVNGPPITNAYHACVRAARLLFTGGRYSAANINNINAQRGAINMLLFRRLALHRFAKTHPPARPVSPAADELIAAYEGVLPASLLELWRQKGLGFYGDLQLTLIDPRAWQPVLDQWIVSSPDAVQRIPIVLTPFGALIYYRKVTATDEDVVYIDPVSKEARTLTWSLDDFFNKFACEQDTL
ncbi:GAD-like domain-containing protein, partial [Trinickia sp.]|uniref:GAD-like domain-containing protein n=1 Tax=Trinickia sp. TaxID=2571163 RepID=UPI003F80B273